MVLGLCRQFSKLPSEIESEGVLLLRLLTIEALGRRNEAQPAVDDPGDDW